MTGQRLWVAGPPPGYMTFGPAMIRDSDAAAEYREMGWTVIGPYVLVSDVVQAIQDEEHRLCDLYGERTPRMDEHIRALFDPPST